MFLQRMKHYCSPYKKHKNKVRPGPLVTLMGRSIEYGIQGTGGIYCYQYGTRAYIKIARSQKVWVIDSKKDHLDRVLIYTSCGRIVEIDFGELFCTEAD